MLRGDPTTGQGKPEPLKHNLSGFWSRRLSQKDRLIYKFDDQYIYIFRHWRSLRAIVKLNYICETKPTFFAIALANG